MGFPEVIAFEVASYNGIGRTEEKPGDVQYFSRGDPRIEKCAFVFAFIHRNKGKCQNRGRLSGRERTPLALFEASIRAPMGLSITQ